MGVEELDGAVRVTSGVHGGRERVFDYPAHVVGCEGTNASLFDQFMPPRIEAFLRGTDVSVLCYGQTGSGKTYTMFGPPGTSYIL